MHKKKIKFIATYRYMTKQLLYSQCYKQNRKPFE